jgi:hypothetical protein
MKAITTKYLPATNFKGSRISASDCDGNRVIISYPADAKDTETAHFKAALELCCKMRWKGKLAAGYTGKGYVFTFIQEWNTYEII